MPWSLIGTLTVALDCPGANATCCLLIFVKLEPASSLWLVTPQQTTPGALASSRSMTSG